MSLNGGAEYLIRHGLGREISREEGLEVLAAGREAGLVHIADNVQEKVTYICDGELVCDQRGTGGLLCTAQTAHPWPVHMPT